MTVQHQVKQQGVLKGGLWKAKDIECRWKLTCEAHFLQQNTRDPNTQ